MYSLLLRKALPFALTFVIGSLVGGLFKAVGFGGRNNYEARAFRYSYGGRHSCRMRFQPRNLVAESKPLNIVNVPDARPAGRPVEVISIHGWTIPATVTFGADGMVHEVVPASNPVYDRNALKGEAADTRYESQLIHEWEAVERAARRIQFEPEIVDGLPVTVTKEVRIRVTYD